MTRRFMYRLAVVGSATEGRAVTDMLVVSFAVGALLLACGAAHLAHAEPSTATLPAPATAPASEPAPDPAVGAATTLSANALYNLGNAYARAGQPALAILNYERASLLAPDDPDIEANLDFVRTAAKQPSPPRTRLIRMLTSLPPTLTAWLGVLGVAGVGIALTTGLISTRYRRLRRTGLTVGTMLIVWNLASAMALWPAVHAAVVVTDATPIRVSPVPMGDPLFTLPLAETVAVTAAHEDFVLIRTRTGKTGWAARSNVVPVVPERFTP